MSSRACVRARMRTFVQDSPDDCFLCIEFSIPLMVQAQSFTCKRECCVSGFENSDLRRDASVPGSPVFLLPSDLCEIVGKKVTQRFPQIFDAMQAGKEALEEMNREVSLEAVEQLLLETQDAMDMQRCSLVPFLFYVPFHVSRHYCFRCSCWERKTPWIGRVDPLGAHLRTGKTVVLLNVRQSHPHSHVPDLILPVHVPCM